MAKMWAGRAEKETAQIADDFNSSLHFDCRMYRQDITGSMAHAAMLSHCGILTEQEALTAFANESNKYVTGSVKLKLYKGNIIPAGTTSPFSLYSENLVTFGESDYDQNQAAGFINLWGLPTKVQALREQGKL